MSFIHRSLHPASRLLAPPERLPCNLSLYLVANRPSFHNEDIFFTKILAAVKGGVSCVQLRDHQNDLSATMKTALRLKQMLQGIPLFINTLNAVHVAYAIDAEGIYLEDNASHSDVRKQLGQKIIIGASIKTLNDVLVFKNTNAIDYISVKISASRKTCPRNDLLWGMEGLHQIRAMTSHRIVAIGGLDLSCVGPVYRALRHDDGVAMAGGIMDALSPEITARKIQSLRNSIMEEK